MIRAVLALWLVFVPPLPAPKVGDASYYAQEYEGKATASGEAYRRKGLTAASWDFYRCDVKVTNLANAKEIVLRVNDRGPARRLNRAIDLSEAAFARLATSEDIARGTMRVRIVAIRRY